MVDETSEEATSKHAEPADSPPDIEPSPDALPSEALRYPEFSFPSDGIDSNGRIDLARELAREEMSEWLDELAGGITSHDIAIESTDGYATFGVAPSGVSVQFDPDENHVGELELTFRLKAKPMFVADDPGGRKTGARGGTGFIPIEMLTTDSDRFQCYNWIDDPTDP